MPYVKTVWVNGATALSAPNMNNIEDGLEDATDRLDLLTAERTITYQFTGNLDATYAGEWDFILPAGLTAISVARLIVRGKAARDISPATTAAATGNTGSDSPNTDTDGTHTHDVTVISVPDTVSTTSAGSHWHSVDSHNHTLNNHTHALTKAVAVSTTPDGVNVYIDNGLGFGPSVANDADPVLIDADIAASITAAVDLKRIRVTSTRLGMVDVVLLITAS